MRIADFVNVTRNSANNQVSFNLKARKLKKLGLTPGCLLNLRVPDDLSPKPVNLKIVKKGVQKNKWK